MKNKYVWIGIILGVLIAKFLLSIDSADSVVHQDMDGECVKVLHYFTSGEVLPGNCDHLPSKYEVVHVADPSEPQFQQ